MEPVITKPAIHVINKDILIINELYNLYNGTLFINDVMLWGKDCNNSNNTTTIVINYSDKDNLVFKYSKRKLSHYHTEDLTVIPTDVYLDKRGNILTHYDIDSDSWDTLEWEYEYKKFEQLYKPVYVEEPVVQSIALHIVEVVYDTGSKYIKPIWTEKTVQKDNRLYKFHYNEFTYDTFVSLINNTGLKWNNDNHRKYLRFCKIEDQYEFSNNSVMFDDKQPILGDMETIKQKMNELEQSIAKIIGLAKAKKFGANGSPDWAQCLKSLQHCDSKLSSIVPQKMYTNDLKEVKRYVRDLIIHIEKSVTTS